MLKLSCHRRHKRFACFVINKGVSKLNSVFHFKFAQMRQACKCHLPLCNKISYISLSIFSETSSDIDNRAHGKGASRGFSATLAAATQRVWPVEDSWLFTDSILKFTLPDTKVEDVSLQVVLSLHNLQNTSHRMPIVLGTFTCSPLIIIGL